VICTCFSTTLRSFAENRTKKRRKITKPAENVLEVAKYAGIVLLSSRHSLDTSKAELIVSLTFLVISQNFVGFCRFLEFFLGCLVPRVLVRMELNGKFSIGLFYFVFCCGFWDTEHFVIITLGHFENPLMKRWLNCNPATSICSLCYLSSSTTL